jgi:hypothetical protein
VEERSGLRPATIASASSLSISEEEDFAVHGPVCPGDRSGSRDARFEGEYQSMRSAPCALAPSHSYHAMPPRITRNSHRPRASDRTMVNAESPVSLAALTNSTASPRHRGNLREWTTSQTSPGKQTYLQWAGSRDTISLSGRSGVFFLTSLFIELIDRTDLLASWVRAGRDPSIVVFRF